MLTERVRIFQEVCRKLDQIKQAGHEVPNTAYTVAASEAHGLHGEKWSLEEICSFCILMGGTRRPAG